MVKTNDTIRLWQASFLALLLTTAVLMAGCGSDEPEQSPVKPDNPETPATPSQPEQPSATAITLNVGRVSQTSLNTRSEDEALSSIELYTTTWDNSQWKAEPGRVNYHPGAATVWQSLVTVRPNVTYYLYGFMPADAIEAPAITPLGAETSEGEGYKTGAKFTFNNLSATASQDICILVGVKRADGEADNNNVNYKGNFEWYSTDETDGTANSVYLLFDHLYAAMEFQVKIDNQYNELRTIILKQLTVTASQKMKSATVTLTGGASPVMTTAFTYEDGAADNTTDIVLNGGRGMTLTTEAQFLNGFFAPNFSGKLAIESTYDVYDKSGNLLRENCTAKNNLKVTTDLKQGEKMTVVMNVKPTYLYVLSDPDLDNPSVTIE